MNVLRIGAVVLVIGFWNSPTRAEYASDVARAKWEIDGQDTFVASCPEIKDLKIPLRVDAGKPVIRGWKVFKGRPTTWVLAYRSGEPVGTSEKYWVERGAVVDVSTRKYLGQGPLSYEGVGEAAPIQDPMWALKGERIEIDDAAYAESYTIP